MSITPIQTPIMGKVAEVMPPALDPVGIKATHGHKTLQQILSKHPELQQSQGLAKSVKQLVELKHKLHRCGRGRGPKRGRRGRRQRMQRRMDRLTQQLMGRLGRAMNHHRKHGCGQTQGTKSGADFGFLNDPSLSMNDKVELFLQQIIKDSESKIEQLMKKHEAQGKATSKPKTPFQKILGVLTKIAPVAATLLGGPAAGMAAKGIGDVVAGAASSQTESAKGSSESDKRMTMLKIQKLQDHVKQMFDFFSTSRKKQSDLIGNIIRNMA